MLKWIHFYLFPYAVSVLLPFLLEVIDKSMNRKGSISRYIDKYNVSIEFQLQIATNISHHHQQKYHFFKRVRFLLAGSSIIANQK
jgi:hypothetical protein